MSLRPHVLHTQQISTRPPTRPPLVGLDLAFTGDPTTEDVMNRTMSLVFATIVASSAHAQSHELVKKWESQATLKVPESVYFD